MHYTNSIDTTKHNKNLLSSKHYPIRILHVVGGMNRGGIETWLMHILRHIDRDRFQMDFLVHTEQACAYDQEIRALGSQIIHCPLNRLQPWIYAANFQRILKMYGTYDVVHSHVHHFNGYILRLAQRSGIPIRIAHSHNNTSCVEAKAKWYRRLYLDLMRAWIARYATLGFGCSHQAIANLFGSDQHIHPHRQTLYYGIDLTVFQDPVDVVAVRSELGIPKDAFVIGHVGRFEPQKNHVFLLDIAAEVAKQEPKMHLLLVGVGSLRADIEQKVAQMGLGDRVIFAGSRPDVPRLMRGAMDVFLLPSLYEGLGLVLIEAQAAGLPCIFSDVIPQEADVVKPLVKRISRSQSASAWAEAVLTAPNNSSALTKLDALNIVEKSAFNIETSVKKLLEGYESQFFKY
ncbi:glycosyltransferase family 1 protein [Chlorogloeopsis sp. ULAP01]|uniref:glycosyltransferase family 1 protein n=1 Tax=Chlorogloeopsis sp. ULAP01 TaxID=3056483 RepID=UPI0025AA5705|nr:glycosyltransferase family 1 protein [Chlorogloeopsis sp. ULAP01]MDM9385235.1 glycosyltransferase family 1 protein [Chlorogloeopsis sp. ULAP01]